jgi:hypothetical protein
VPGLYAVKLTGYNESFPGGVTATVTVTVVAAVCYVNAASTHPVFPFGSWETAATTVQDAVDAASVPGTVVWVTNGIYSVGGGIAEGTALANRVLVHKPITLQSVNGPEVTIIQGDSGITLCAVFL